MMSLVGRIMFRILCCVFKHFNFISIYIQCWVAASSSFLWCPPPLQSHVCVGCKRCKAGELNEAEPVWLSAVIIPGQWWEYAFCKAKAHSEWVISGLWQWISTVDTAGTIESLYWPAASGSGQEPAAPLTRSPCRGWWGQWRKSPGALFLASRTLVKNAAWPGLTPSGVTPHTLSWTVFAGGLPERGSAAFAAEQPGSTTASSLFP